MNVSELARQLRTNTAQLLELLPRYGFDVGQKAIKVDDKVAAQIIRRWKFIRLDLEEKKKKELEEKKKKEREMRKQAGHAIELPERIRVRDFAEKLNLSVTEVITELMRNGILANQNQDIDYDTAAIMADQFGFSAAKGGVEKKEISAETNEELEKILAGGEHRGARPPVVVVMGHVDHGKTRLLDAIRETNVMASEAGGITQHIGAYQTLWKDPKTKAERPIAFIDTPGHEAFTVMRSRGAKVADIAILLVAADDGVKPQTKEAIQIIKAAQLPFVVAINKIDKDTADVPRVKTELSAVGVLTEEWGGDIPAVEISAKQKMNIDKFLDVLLLVADLHGEDIQADPAMPAVGTIIESHKDKHMGPVATVLVQAGTLKKGDPLVVNGEIYGKVRALRNDRGGELETAGPSTPVQIIGFKVAPEIGDILNVGQAGTAVKINIREKTARQTGAEQRLPSVSETESEEEDEEKKKNLNVLIKADVLGSLEAIVGSLEKIKHDEVGVKIVGKGLGNITEDDVARAEAGHAAIVGFHVNPMPTAEVLLREKNISFLRYEVIYDLLNWVKDELEKLLEKEKIVTELGNLKVLAIFRTDKGAMTVGGRVEEGKVKPDALVRVKRGGEIVGTGKISSCQVGKQTVKEAPAGTECGVRYEGKTKIEEGDVLEVYTEESKARKIVFT